MLSFPYCALAGSSFLARTQFDPFSDLESKLSNAAQDGDLICFGDFNARTGTELNYLTNEDNTHIPIPEGTYLTDTVATYPRGNRDVVTNEYGEQLISLCKSLPLRICNGRKLGDVLGNFTCFKWNGQSSVDYCLASPNVYNNIGSFQVHSLLPHLSDHCSISITISTDIHHNISKDKTHLLLPKPKKVVWSKQIHENFENLIQSSDSKNFLSNFAANSICQEQTSIDVATKVFTDFLINSAILANDQKFISYRGQKKSPKPNWKFKKNLRRSQNPSRHEKRSRRPDAV